MVMEDSGFKALAEKVICVAGHKVTNDPVAIPFSMVSSCVLPHVWRWDYSDCIACGGACARMFRRQNSTIRVNAVVIKIIWFGEQRQ